MQPSNQQNLQNDIPDEDEFDFAEDLGGDAEAAKFEPITLTLSDDVYGERLDKLLSRLVPQFSRSRIQQWLEDGFVTVDGQHVKGKTAMMGGERVHIEPQANAADRAYQAEPVPFSVIYEDETLLVIDKPVGLVVHPGAGNWSGTLLNGLLHRNPASQAVPRAGIVHRLDKDTSGLMVVAKTLEAQTSLVRQLQARTVKREYLALVWGSPRLQGKVDAAMARHPRDRIKMAVSQSVMAKSAVTHYERIATGAIDDKPVSLVRCELETGRTHQIRVHMQSIGFPLVGDALYGKSHLAHHFPRQALHAFRLSLVHPASGEDMSWTSAIAPDLRDLLDQAGIVLPDEFSL